ncbi:tRNA pseudouridine(55) synthase TruB [Nocardiopsis trehalosi]|uniref:tRNA pseudouridine(55) synthase TruB n=1 Tax=Nocardiopsis trehalosi TaxID=109329 RepID=UPI00082C8AD5|nr:tRNA pseudouridine(55) synthase TruB [Nocardiopsis trehalosi]
MTESGVVIVDKPAGWTSHDVVARVRRLAGTRKVGHAGTLDPMATGVLVLGIEKGTKLLGHLTLTDKTYEATLRLGLTTSTDDAEGEPGARTDAAGVADAAVYAGAAALTGTLRQVPPQVSAIKVNGKRAYASARAGVEVELKAREVTVAEFTVHAVRRVQDADGVLVDVDARVTCSSGTYIRALARDLGAALGVGGHLTALRRTRVGPYTLDQARTLDALAEEFTAVPLARAVAAAFPVRVLDADEARRVAHGNRIAPGSLGPGPIGLFAPDGTVVALAEERPGHSRPIVVFEPAGG